MNTSPTSRARGRLTAALQRQTSIRAGLGNLDPRIICTVGLSEEHDCSCLDQVSHDAARLLTDCPLLLSRVFPSPNIPQLRLKSLERVAISLCYFVTQTVIFVSLNKQSCYLSICRILNFMNNYNSLVGFIRRSRPHMLSWILRLHILHQIYY